MKVGLLYQLLVAYKFLLRHNIQTLIPTSVINRVINSRFSNKVYDIDGHRMYLNEGLFSLSLGLPFEPGGTQIVKTFVRRGDTVVDLGANIGYYTLTLARQVGDKGRVIAFEPSPTNCRLLKLNIEMNGYKHVEVNQLAISDKSERTRLYLSVNPGDNRIYPAYTTGRQLVNGMSDSYIDTDTLSLDDYIGNKNINVDFIKMDIQGSEFFALKGMQSVLERNDDIKILTEFAPKLLKESGCDPFEFLELSKQLGFLLYNIDEKAGTPKGTTEDALLSKYTVERESYTNLLLTKNEIDFPVEV